MLSIQNAQKTAEALNKTSKIDLPNRSKVSKASKIK